MPAITQDLPCDICSYNLRGIDDAGNCPECGQPVARTLNAALHLSDPAWLRYQATTMLLLAILALINYSSERFSRNYIVYEYVRYALHVVCALVAVWACWRVSTPEPPLPLSETPGAINRALRVLPAGYAAFLILSLFRESLGHRLIGFLGFVAFVCVLLMNWFVALLLYRLARRSRDPLLILHARIVLWSLPLAQITVFGVGAILAWLWQLRDAAPGGTDIISVLMVLMDLAIVLAVFAFALLLGRLHEVLNRAANDSESTRLSLTSANVDVANRDFP